MSKLTTILLAAFVLFSCKNDKTLENKEELAPKNEINTFRVAFDLTVLKDDNFHLYYTQDGTINFDENQSVWLPVKGSANQQEVVFNLPQDVIPTHLRIDFGFGKNESQSDIVLKSFRMNYFDKKFEATDGQIFNYFYPNELSTIIDKTTFTLKKVKKDQESGPSLYPQIGLTEEITKMTR